MESTQDLVFSYGKWSCLGKSVALVELNKIFVEVSRSPTTKTSVVFTLTDPQLLV